MNLQEFVEAESRATAIRAIDAGVAIHGLLQTRTYMRAALDNWSRLAVLISEEDKKHILYTRVKRQEQILGGDNPPALRVVIDFQSLTCRYTSVADHIEQLKHIIALSKCSNIKIRIIPPEKSNLRMAHFYEIVDIFDYGDESSVFIESARGLHRCKSATESRRLDLLFSFLYSEALNEEQSVECIKKLIDSYT